MMSETFVMFLKSSQPAPDGCRMQDAGCRMQDGGCGVVRMHDFLKLWMFGLCVVFSQVILVTSVDAGVNCNMSKEKRLRYLHSASGVDLGVDKPLPGCPGWDDFDPGFANLEIENINFRIPRDYISFSADQADGPSGIVILGVGVRSLKDRWRVHYSEEKTDIFLSRDQKRKVCGKDRCYKSGHLFFLAQLNGVSLEDFLDKPDDLQRKSNDFLNRLTPGKGRLFGFDVADHEGVTVAVKGGKNDVIEWFICSKKTMQCHSKTVVFPNIFMNLNRKFIGLERLISFRDRVETLLLPKFIED